LVRPVYILTPTYMPGDRQQVASNKFCGRLRSAEVRGQSREVGTGQCFAALRSTILDFGTVYLAP